MSLLSGNNVGTNYKGILNLGTTINTPLSTTLQAVTDGDGVASPLQLGTTLVGVTSSILHDWNSTPTGVAGKTSMWFDASGRMAWRLGTGASSYIRTFDATGITADRVYTLPDATTTLAGLAVANTFTERQIINAPTLTGSSATSALSLTQIWNTAGSPTGLFLNITNTASGASAYAFDFQISSASIARLTKAGLLDFANSTTGGIIFGGSTSKGIFFASSNNATTIYSNQTSHTFRVYNGSAYAQRAMLDNTGFYIGTGTIKASASLEVESTTQGFLPPRMTTTQKNAISSPTAGLIVYDSTLAKLCVYTTSWETITSS